MFAGHQPELLFWRKLCLTVLCVCDVCIVQRLGTFGPLRCGEMYALDRLLREARVLELIRRVAKDTADNVTQTEEGQSTRSFSKLNSVCQST